MEQFLTYMVKDICIYSPICGPDLNKHSKGYMYIQSNIWTRSKKHGPRYMHIYIYIVQYMEQFLLNMVKDICIYKVQYMDQI